MELREPGDPGVTVLLRRWREGDETAMADLMPIVYGELHRLAAGALRGERPGHTLRATDLVSEAYLRLARADLPELKDRVHFFAVSARMMRRIIIDHARERVAQKRGGAERALTLDEGLVASQRPDELVALDEALVELAGFDERKARAVEMHYFGGMTREHIATALGVHVNTVASDLRLAAAWLQRRLVAR